MALTTNWSDLIIWGSLVSSLRAFQVPWWFLDHTNWSYHCIIIKRFTKTWKLQDLPKHGKSMEFDIGIGLGTWKCHLTKGCKVFIYFLLVFKSVFFTLFLISFYPLQVWTDRDRQNIYDGGREIRWSDHDLGKRPSFWNHTPSHASALQYPRRKPCKFYSRRPEAG